MKPVLSAFVLVSLLAQVICSPAPYSKQVKHEKEKVLYDQRQEGEWNIQADLKNFVIVIIPKSPISDESTPSTSFLDFFRSHSKHGKHVKAHQSKAPLDTNEIPAETMHFIESKTAPYHVDISQSASHLLNDEITASQTPPVAIALKTNEDKIKSTEDHPDKTNALLRQLRSTRFSKAFILTVPEEEFILTKMEEDKKVVKKDGLKNKAKNSKEEMLLLGAAEQCGPEMYRDADGVCRLRKLVDSSESIESIESIDREE